QLDDVEQETMIDAWRALENRKIRGNETQPPTQRLEAWLLEAAYRRSLRALRFLRSHDELNDATPDDSISSPDDRVDARALLAKVLSQETDDMDELLEHALGSSCAEVASKLHKPESKVWQKFERTRRLLKKSLQRRGNDE
ncbi:MAG TPA: hypothetical protein PK156_33750, partial [Polyangium sp.]|nr:hypothetical protein [Polyangium sp.]